MAGSAVLMPHLTHLETWPTFHIPFVTYWPLKWDVSDLADAYEHLLGDDKMRVEIAARGQETYRQAWSRTGKETFCVRFKSIIEGTCAHRMASECRGPEPASIHEAALS
jgi:hypothetical protein